MATPLLVRAARRLLRRAGHAVLASDELADLKTEAARGDKYRRLGMIDDHELRRTLDLLPASESQINQDFWVLHELGWKRDGYFVEFGAADGRTLSNTWLLEKAFGWNGILAEPARGWRETLLAAGRSAALEFDCVWANSGETLDFGEDTVGEFSTIARFEASDRHARHIASRYAVRTVSLPDLLARHNAPPVIDYLSIDTEGSEYEILAAHDFERFAIRCISCEHNFTPQRDAIRDLLEARGYERRFAELSAFDDWYLLRA